MYASGARRILELGTYSGYSSISMAAGLPPGGEIHTCEIDEKHAEVARRYIEQAGCADRITVHLGPGIETIERLGGEWDLVFIDADKPNYLNYYEAVVPRLDRARAHRRRQHALERQGAGPERRLGGHGRDPRVQRPRALRRARRVRAATIRDGVTLIRRA